MIMPSDASDIDDIHDIPDEVIPTKGSAYIHNKFSGKELLTPIEAIDLISALSSELLADGYFRS